MPTLEGIQGSSLQPRVDVVDVFSEGAAAGEELRNIRNRKGIDAALAEAASGGGATDIQASGGAGVTPGSRSAGGAKMPGALATAQASGQVDANRPAFSPLEDIERYQQQLMQYGEQGMVAAQNLGILRDQAQARINQAAQREAEQVAQLSTSLRTMGYEDRKEVLERLRREHGDNPNMLKFTDKLLSARNATEQDFMLHRAETRALGAAERMQMKGEAEDRAIEGRKAQTAAYNAATSRAKLGQNERQIDVSEDRLDQQITEFEAKPEEEQRALANKAAGPVLDKANSAVSIGNQTLMTTRRMSELIEQMEAAEGGTVTVGLQERLASAASAIDPALGEKVREGLQVGEAADMAALNTIAAQTLAIQIAEMSKAGFSNADLEAQRQTLANMSQASTAEMKSTISEVERNINSSVRFAQDLIDTSIKPIDQGGGGMGVMKKASENAKEQRQITNSKNWPDAPEIGTVENGFEYVGGNPGGRGNWRQVTQ